MAGATGRVAKIELLLNERNKSKGYALYTMGAVLGARCRIRVYCFLIFSLSFLFLSLPLALFSSSYVWLTASYGSMSIFLVFISVCPSICVQYVSTFVIPLSLSLFLYLLSIFFSYSPEPVFKDEKKKNRQTKRTKAKALNLQSVRICREIVCNAGIYAVLQGS